MKAEPDHSTDQARFSHLDGLRAVAMLLVLWMHTADAFFRDQPSSILRTLIYEWPNDLRIGRVGVALFFVVSGFLIARSLEDKTWRSRFPIKRALRLYPAYIVSITLALAFGIVSFDWSQIAANLTMIPSVFGENEILGIYWTLQTEVIFYAFFYFTFMLGWGRTPLSLVIISACFTTVFIISRLCLDVTTLKSLPFVFEKLPQHLGIMFLGAYLYKVGRAGMATLPALCLFIFTLAPVLYTFAIYAAGNLGGSPPVMLSYLYAITLSWAALYFAPRFPRALTYLGKISYSIYLNHALILLIYTRCAPQSKLPALLDMALLVALTIATSAFTYRYVELPAMRLKRQ